MPGASRRVTGQEGGRSLLSSSPPTGESSVARGRDAEAYVPRPRGTGRGPVDYRRRPTWIRCDREPFGPRKARKTSKEAIASAPGGRSFPGFHALLGCSWSKRSSCPSPRPRVTESALVG